MESVKNWTCLENIGGKIIRTSWSVFVRRNV